MAYSQIEPWGFDIENWRAASIARVIAEVNRDRKSKPTPFEIADFVPRMSGPEPETTKAAPAETLFAQFKAMFTGKS